MPHLSTLELPELPMSLMAEAGGELPLRGVTVLAVEDSRFSSEALRLICRRLGARLRRTDSLQMAAAHLRLYRPDVVIVDLGLPDGRGEDLIAELHLRKPRPAIIAISGDAEGRRLALEKGADSFLEKPLSGLGELAALMLRLFPERVGSLGNGAGVAPDRLALRDDLAHADIATLVLHGEVVERRPAAYVRPARIDGNDDEPFGAFHDCIIDRLRRAGEE